MEGIDENIQQFREMNKTAFVLGYTGETGKALVQDLVNRNIFQKIVLFGRREVSFPDEDKYKCLEQRRIDYENLGSHEADFTGCDVGYCCLGTTRGKSGKDGFYKVDHDYIVNSAKLAKDTGCTQFHLVSSTGANESSFFLYPKVKGQVEKEIKAFGFDFCAVYRPAALICDRQERRMGEKILLGLLKPVIWMAPMSIATPTTLLATAMVNTTVTPFTENFKLLENREIYKMAGELKDKKKSAEK